MTVRDVQAGGAGPPLLSVARIRRTLADERGFLGFIGDAFKLAKGVVGTAVKVGKSVLGRGRPPSTPAQWRPGQPAPPGYTVVNKGTRSERLAGVSETADAGESSSTAGADRARTGVARFLEDARRLLADEVAKATGGVARAVGAQAAAGAVESSVFQEREKKLRLALGIGAIAIGVTLAVVVALAWGRSKGK